MEFKQLEAFVAVVDYGSFWSGPPPLSDTAYDQCAYTFPGR